MRFRFVEVEKALYPVALMCRILQVSRAGFYAWSARAESARSRADRALLVDIKVAHRVSRGTYGSPRIRRELADGGQQVGRGRIARLMRQSGLQGKAKRRFRNTTDSNHRHPIAANLLKRQFTVSRPNAVWVGDITCVWTLQGWLYVAVLLDLYSRRVVGWAMGKRINQALPLRALRMALSAREPAAGLIHHTDRGSQYAAKDYQKLLKGRGLVCSMSRKGDCWDNAVAESFFATLKGDLDRDCAYFTRAEATSEIFEYIEGFYNRRRRHSFLDYVSPQAFETGFNGLPTAA